MPGLLGRAALFYPFREIAGGIALEADGEDALRIANIATPLGGRSFNYFGPLVSEQLTK